MGKHRHGRRTRAALAALLCVTLSGCSLVDMITGEADPTVTPEPVSTLYVGAATEGEFTEIDAPAELAPSAARFTHSGVLGATDALPFLAYGTEDLADGRTVAALWTSPDGTSWQRVELPSDEGSTHTSIRAGTDGQRTVVVMSVTNANHRRSVIAFESADRVTWTAVDTPDSVRERGFVPQAVAVVGEDTKVFGVDGTYTPTALLMGSVRKLIQLPKAEDGDDFGQFDGVAADGETLVVVARLQVPGDDPGPASYRSEDGGLTWTGPHQEFGTERGFLSGVVRAGSFWVAAGADSSQNSWKPQGWSSADGIRWEFDSFSDPGGSASVDPEGDAYLTAPSVSGDHVVAALSNAASRATAVMVRQGGFWDLGAVASNWIGRFVDAAATVGPGGRVVLARTSRSVMDLGTADLSSVTGQITSAATFGTERGDIQIESMTATFSGSASIIAAEETIEFHDANDDFWAVYDLPFGVELEGMSPASTAAIEPTEARELETVLTVMDPTTGEELVIGNDFRVGVYGSDDSDLYSWFRASPSAAWQAGSGLAAPQAEAIVEVRRLPREWVAVGQDRDSAGYTSYGRAAVWTSTDGIDWTRQDGPFDGDQSGSSRMRTAATDACALPSGELMVVGWTQRGTSGRSPRAWLRSGNGSWSTVAPEVFGDGSGSLSSCATSEAGVVVQGAYGGRSMLWKGDNARDFDQIRIGERGESFGRLVALRDGGYAAGGFIDRGTSHGAVAWMSRDGEHWFNVYLPTSAPLDDGQVADRGDSLLVAAGAAGGSRLWAMTNPYDVLN